MGTGGTTRADMPRTAVVPAPTGARGPVPAGAAKMQTWYIDTDGRRVRTPTPVPVDGDDQRTTHLLFHCHARCEHTEWLLPGSVRYCPDHGKEPLREPRTQAGLVDVAREVARLHGASAAPWALLAAEAAVGIGTQIGDLPTTYAAATVPLLAGAGYAIARRTLTARAIRRRRIERGQKAGRRVQQIIRTSRQVAAAGAATGTWLTAAAATNPHTLTGQLAWAGMAVSWAVGCYPWWRTSERRRTRDLAPTPVVEVTAAAAPALPDPVALRAESTWKLRIGCPGGPLAGTHLETFARLPGGPDGENPNRTRLANWAARVVADDPGSINMREDRPNLLGRIAAAYHCTYADVSFAADESDLSVAYLRVQPDNVLAEPRMWRGPGSANEWRRGRSAVGRFDDSQPIIYRWWSDTGAVHDLISGCTGSGKSELVCQLLLNSLHSGGHVLDWVGDPQGGQSYGALKDAVDWFARDKTEIIFMLLAAVKEMLRRNDALSSANEKTWRATRDMPLLVITLDEVQSYISDPVILDLVEKLVGQGRKCGIKMRLITQIPAAYNLGDSTYIKEQLKAGQAFVFRSADDVAARSAVDGDLPIDPTLLPRKWGPATCNPGMTTAGLMFVIGLEGRDVYGRSDWTGEDMRRWLFDGAGELTVSPGVFSEAARQESGVLWGDRKARIARALAAGRSDADLLPGGKALELIEMAAASATNLTAVGSLPTQPVKGPTSRDVVLAAAQKAGDANGVVTRDQIKKGTAELKDSTRDKALTDLVADGALKRIRNGVYAVAVKTSAPV